MSYNDLAGLLVPKVLPLSLFIFILSPVIGVNAKARTIKSNYHSLLHVVSSQSTHFFPFFHSVSSSIELLVRVGVSKCRERFRW